MATDAVGSLVIPDDTIALGEAAFSAWYRGHYRSVFAVALAACRSRAIAQDATDEAFARAAERWGRVQGMASPTGWACRVAANEATRLMRKAKRQVATREPTTVDLGPDVDLWSAVARLPRRQREAIALRYIADLTESEVARTMGISTGAASATLSSARARLAALLTAGRDGATDE